MKPIKITKTACCAICEQESKDGVVFEKRILSLDDQPRAYFTADKLSVAEVSVPGVKKAEFLCSECLRNISGLALAQFLNDDFKIFEGSSQNSAHCLAIVRDLLDSNLFTTSLQVKEALRKEGHIVKQKTIRNLLAEIENYAPHISKILFEEFEDYPAHFMYYDPSKYYDVIITTKVGDKEVVFNISKIHSTPVHVFKAFFEQLQTLEIEDQLDLLSITDTPANVISEIEIYDEAWKFFNTKVHYSLQENNLKDVEE